MSLSLCLAAARPGLIQRIAHLSRVSPLVSTRLQSSSSSASAGSSPDSNPENLPFITTGIHEARYPVQEMLAIHRKAAKTEDPKYERRRRIGLVKIAIAAAVELGTVISVCLFLFWWWTAEGYP